MLNLAGALDPNVTSWSDLFASKKLRYLPLVILAFAYLLMIPGLLENNAALLMLFIELGKLTLSHFGAIISFITVSSSLSEFAFIVATWPMWFPIAVVALVAIAIYGLILLFKWYFKIIYNALKVTKVHILLVLIATAFTYFMFVHIFACIYLGLILWDPDSFAYDHRNLKAEGLDAISAYYFSLSTIATVGFGDIHPSSKSSLSKFVVMIEIFFGVGYTAFIFSILATFIRESRLKLGVQGDSFDHNTKVDHHPDAGLIEGSEQSSAQ